MPDSISQFLASKVLHAKYYRNSSFFNARVGSNPSFVWRSILRGRQVIKKLVRWRIGNASNILVYKHSWLPRPYTLKPISPPTLPMETIMPELIDEENQWDVAKLNQHFIYEDTEVILKIVLPRNQKEDEIQR